MWRITVPPHLRRRRRGYQNACYHATKENGFSPVHNVRGFKKLNPPGFEKCRRSRIGGNVVITFGLVSSPPSDARRGCRDIRTAKETRMAAVLLLPWGKGEQP
jgi:hypothetical protein